MSLTEEQMTPVGEFKVLCMNYAKRELLVELIESCLIIETEPGHVIAVITREELIRRIERLNR